MFRLKGAVCNDQEKKTFSCIEYKKERSIQDLITNAYLYFASLYSSDEETSYSREDYFAGMKKDKIAAPTLIKGIQKVFNRNYPTFIAKAKGAKDFLLRV